MNTTLYSKKLFVTLALFLCLFAGNSQKTFAGLFSVGGVGGATEVTQVANMVILTASKGFEHITSVATYALQYKEYILDLAANIVIEGMLQEVANTLITWVNDGFSGNYPLIVSNPQEHLRNVGLDTARISLNNLGEGYFSDSIFNTIRETATWEYMPIQDKLEELSKSNTAELVQANSCGESTISSLASESGVDASELYEYLCEGDPSDPEVKARLEGYAEENPEATGWDGWLSLTGGNNPYTRANTFARNEQGSEETGDITREQLDLYEGQNPLSERECVDGGEDGEACEETELTTPSDTVSETLSKSATAGLERLFNIQGEFSFGSLLTSFATQALLGGIRKGVSGLGGSRGGGLTTVSSNVTGGPTTSLSTEDKTKIMSSITPMLTDYSTQTDTAERPVEQYGGALTTYLHRFDQVKKCRTDVLALGKTWDDSLYQERMRYIESEQKIVEGERTNIRDMRALIQKISNDITATSDPTAITTILKNFQDQAQSSWIFDGASVLEKERRLSQQTTTFTTDTTPATLLNSCNSVLHPVTDTGPVT
jgi:hypothetical protein